jgi:hypothetical protein
VKDIHGGNWSTGYTLPLLWDFAGLESLSGSMH